MDTELKPITSSSKVMSVSWEKPEHTNTQKIKGDFSYAPGDKGYVIVYENNVVMPVIHKCYEQALAEAAELSKRCQVSAKVAPLSTIYFGIIKCAYGIPHRDFIISRIHDRNTETTVVKQ